MKTTENRVRPRKFLVWLVMLGLLTSVLSGAPGLAHAAAVVSNESGSISGPSEAYVGVGEASYALTYNGTVTGSAGDSWSIQLPTQIEHWPAGFVITDPNDASKTWINVSISGSTATYTLTPDGAAETNLRFESWFGGTIRRDLGEGSETLILKGAHSQEIASTGVTLTAMPTVELDTEPGKRLWFVNDSDQCREEPAGCLAYQLRMPRGDNGTITIVDKAEANWRFVCEPLPRVLAMVRVEGNYPQFDKSISVDHSVTCTPEELRVTVNTAGMPDTQAPILQAGMSATEPGGDGGVRYVNTAAFTINGETVERSAEVTSSYAGGIADGAHISILKKDAAGNDANTTAEAVELPDGTTSLVYTIRNVGTQDLRNLTVTDQVTVGTATVSALSCAFPGGSTGTEWAGPLASGASFTCTANLAGVAGAHTNIGAVTAVGEGDMPVSDADPYNAKRESTPEPPVPAIDLRKQAEGDDSTNVSPGTHPIEAVFTNTGEEDLQDLLFTDTTNSGNAVVWNQAELDALNSLVLKVGQTTKVTGTVAVAYGETHRDTARITATGVITGTPVSDDDPTTLVPPAPPVPGIDIAKQAEGDDSTNVQPGDHDIVVTITNNGAEPLEDLTFTDTTESGHDVVWNQEHLDALNGLVLPIGESVIVRGTVRVDYGTTHRDSVLVTATGTITGKPVQDEDPTTLVPPVPPVPGIDVAKQAEGDDSTNVQPGDHDIVVTITNNGKEDLKDITFEDKTASGNDVVWNTEDIAGLTGKVLKIGESATVRGTVRVDVGVPHRDTVTMTAVGVISGKPVSDEDPTTLIPPAPTPKIDVAKNTEGDDIYYVPVGEHEIVVSITNRGDEALKDLVFADTTENGHDVVWNEEDIAGLDGLVLTVNGVVKVRGTVQVDADDFHRDTVLVTANGLISGKPVQDDDPTTLLPPEQPAIDVVKNDRGDDVHQVAPGEHPVIVEFANAGTEPLEDLTFTDTTEAGQDVVWDEADLAALDELVLDVGEAVTVHGTVTVKSGEKHRDTVRITASGVISGDPVEGEDPTTLIPPVPKIDVIKNEAGDDTHKVQPGEHEVIVQFTNRGEEPLKDITFSDKTEAGNAVVWNKDHLAALKGKVLEIGETVTVRGMVTVDPGEKHRDTVSVFATGVISGETTSGDDPTTLDPGDPTGGGISAGDVPLLGRPVWVLGGLGFVLLLTAAGVAVAVNRKKREQ